MNNYNPNIKAGSKVRIITEDNYEIFAKVNSINYNKDGLSKLMYEIEDVIIHEENCKCDDKDKNSKKK
jgi:hypothetical protein